MMKGNQTESEVDNKLISTVILCKKIPTAL